MGLAHISQSLACSLHQCVCSPIKMQILTNTTFVYRPTGLDREKRDRQTIRQS